MTNKIKRFFFRHRLEAVYLVVGGATTLINLIAYFFIKEICGVYYVSANVAAWCAAILFAYVANRKWVFGSANTNIPLEIWLFVCSRLFSLLLETGCLLAAVEVLGIIGWEVKLIAAAFVVVCNYITGKLLVFKKRK